MTNTAQIWLIVGITVGALLLIACVITIACITIIATSDDNDVLETPSAEAPVSPDVETPTPETPRPSGGVTLANFERVKTGMTYAQVSEIFGAPGDLSMETDIVGTKMEIYSWRAATGFGNATISFRDGRVASKAQFGLE